MIKAILLTLIFLLGTSEITLSQASDRIPREYTNPEEVISFDRRTPFKDAVEVLTNYAQRFEDRFIIDRSNVTGPIGVSLPPMHWKDALNYIMRVQNLVALESEDVIEIVTEQEANEILGEDETKVAAKDPEAPGKEGRVINTDTREIRINATFFEGNKRALREIGVDWSTLTNNVPQNITDFVTEGGGDGELPSVEFGGQQFVSVNAKGAQNVSQNVFNSLINFGEIGGGIEVQALFSAFEADNLGQILATPSVKVMDGEEGRIQVGQDFSIKQRDFAGNVTDQFFSTGTILRVKPQIVEVGDTTLIYLDLEAERSSAQPDPVSTIINKQQANTHALLLDGESTVIAGLYRTEQTEIRRGIPILKDLPGWFFGLKYLFGYNSTDVQESELVVLLQAELEEPLDNRLQRAFRSKGDLLEEKKELNRNTMNYISDKSPVDTVTPSPPSVDHTEPDLKIEKELLNQNAEEPADKVSENNSNTRPDSEDIEESAQSVSQEEAPVRNSTTELKPVEPITKRAVPAEEKEKPEVEKTDPEEEIAEEPLEIKEEATKVEENETEVSGYNLRDLKPVEIENVMEDGTEYEFYIIGGSFKTRAYAMQYFSKFKNDHSNAQLLYDPNSKFFLVAYEGYPTFQDGIAQLIDINDNVQPDAWMVRVKN